MSVADDIIARGNKKRKKEEENSVANQIIKGTYKPDTFDILPELPVATPSTENKTLLDDLGYIGKNAVSGAWSGLTGLFSSASSETKESIKQGQNKNILENALDVFNAAQNIINPVKGVTNAFKNTAQYVSNAAKEITDKDKNLGQKIGSYLTESVPIAKDSINPYTQLAKKAIQFDSNITGKENAQKIYEGVESLEDLIVKPSEEYNKQLQEEAQEYGGLTQFLGQTANVVANMTPSIAATLITKDPDFGLQVMGASAKGTATREALAKGADLEQALKIGNTKGAIEIGTEMLSGGINIFGKGAIDDIVERGVNKLVKNKVANFLVKKGLVDTAGEVAEETISDILGTMIDSGTVDPDAKYSIQDWSDTALTTMLSTVVINALTGGLGGKAFKENAKDIKDLTNNEKNVINLMVQERVNEAEKNGEKVSEQKIRKQITEDLENGGIDLDDIEKSLGGEYYTKYQDTQTQFDELQSKIDELLDKDTTTERQKRDVEKQLATLEQQQKNLNLDDIKRQLSSYVNDLTQNDSLIRKNYDEYFKKGQKYEIGDTTNISDKQLEQLKRFEEKGISNNTTTNREFLQSMAKIHEDKGIWFNLVDSKEAKDHLINNMIDEYMAKNNLTELTEEQRNQLYNELQGKYKNRVVNGFVKNGEVYINVDSAKYLNTVLGHEITHLFEGDTKLYRKLRKEALEFAKTKGEYQARLEQLGENYNEISSELETELVNDIIGDYLFSDEEFVKRLSTNKTLFEKIYNEIKYLANVITGRKEQAQLQKVKNMFEKVYRQTTVNQTSDTKYHISANAETDIDNVLNNIKERSPIKLRDFTPKILVENGVEDLPMYANPSHIRKNILTDKEAQKLGLKISEDDHYHSLGKELYLKAIDSLDNPRVIFKNKQSGDYIVLTLIKDNNNNNILVPIEISSETYVGKDKINNNRIKTIFGYDRTNPDLNEYIKYNLKNDKFEKIYEQKKNPSTDIAPQSDSITNNIPQTTTKVNDISINSNMQESEKNTQELDNSSFSIEENYRGSHQIENAKPITELNVDDITAKIMDVDGYLTKQSESDLRKLKKILNNPNEKVTIYRAAPVNELNNGDWVTTDRSYAQNVANNNGGKVYSYEVNANELYYPDNVNDLPSLHRLSSFQYNENTQNNVKYSISQDNQGRKLSKQQQEYFKDSKVRDENGNLLEVYHSSSNEFNIFDKNKIGKKGKNAWGSGFYFTPNQEYAQKFGDKTKQVYLNIINPYVVADDYELMNIVNMRQDALSNGYDLDDYLKEEGYDGLIVYDEDTDGNDLTEIIAFEPNQIKNIANTNPTTNEDIRYSISNQNEDIAPIGNYRIKGEDIKLQDIAPIETKQEVKEAIKPKVETSKKEEIELPFDYEEPLEVKGLDSKTINKITNNLKSELSLSAYETKEFKNVLSDISKNDNITKEEISNLIEKKFGEKTLKVRIDEIADIKKELRNTKIFVPDYVKIDIPDYSDFRQKNYGKIQFSKEGMAIDKVYDELAEMYPEYFDKEISNEADQLQEIARVANLDKYITNTEYLDEERINKAAEWIYDSIEDYSMQKQVEEGSLGYNEYLEKTKQNDTQFKRKATIKQNRELAAEYLDNMNSWKDTPLFKQKINTMKRNLRDIMSKSEADTLYNEYFAPISKNNATIERETKKYNNRIDKLNLNKNESTAVQLLGELKYNPETTLTKEEVYDFINKHNLNETKLDNAVNTFRNVYDDLFGRVNKVLEDNGYTPIGYKKGYFPHFTEEHGKNILGKLAEKLGWQFNSQKLPTDIAGLTDTFTPGKKWVSFAQHRTGDVTDYNALKGFDNYVRGAMQVIHHTEDIQKLRGLENEIRYQYSEKGVKEKLDKIFNNDELDTEEKQNQIDTLLQGYNSGLGNFVMNLREYTNNLAGKKSALDRSVEFTMGRNIYNTMNNISSRVSANMVGLNLSSALTNFIPITQAWSQISTKNMLRAMKQTISNQVRSDGFVDKSDYLTNRINSADKLYKTGLEKVSDKASVLFDAIDSFSSQVIVRGKYLDNIQKGMSESEALNNANEFAKDVMAGRSQGDKPTIFNSTSPITKLFTAFQLEVNNQYGYMFKDLPNDLKDKGMGLLIGAFIKMFLGAWLYNKMSEELTGRKSAFSPVDIVADSVKTMQREDLDEYSKISSIAKDISDESPFISGLLGGGRLPISSAIPDIPTLTENIINLKDEEKKDKAIKGIQKELEKPLFYVVMPFGGGQLKKTKDAISMYNEDLPVAGSYTDSGNLRFTADETPEGKLKAFLFGQYSSKEAQEYVESGYKSIPNKKIQELKDLDMSASEYRKYSNDLKSAGTTNADKINFISNSNYTDKQKNIMAKNVLNKDIDMKKYKNYGSYEEADYAINNPEKYLLSKVTSNTFNGYKNYVKDLNSIKADKDSNGKSISNSRKNKVLDYINNINEDYGSKLILYKMEYPSDNSYNSEIVDYLNNKDNITLNEEKKILSYLGMTVTDDGSVRW